HGVAEFARIQGASGGGFQPPWAATANRSRRPLLRVLANSATASYPPYAQGAPHGTTRHLVFRSVGWTFDRRHGPEGERVRLSRSRAGLLGRSLRGGQGAK